MDAKFVPKLLQDFLQVSQSCCFRKNSKPFRNLIVFLEIRILIGQEVLWERKYLTLFKGRQFRILLISFQFQVRQHRKNRLPVQNFQNLERSEFQKMAPGGTPAPLRGTNLARFPSLHPGNPRLDFRKQLNRTFRR